MERTCRKVPETKLTQMGSGPLLPCLLSSLELYCLEYGCDGSGSSNHFGLLGDPERDRKRGGAWIPDNFIVLQMTHL